MLYADAGTGALDGETIRSREGGGATDELLFTLINPSLRMVALLSHHLNTV